MENEINTVDEIYNIIGNDIVNSVPEEWTEIELHIEAYLNDYVQFSGKYNTKSDEKKSINVRKLNLDELENAIYKLMEIMTDGNNKNKWNRAVYKK